MVLNLNKLVRLWRRNIFYFKHRKMHIWTLFFLFFFSPLVYFRRKKFRFILPDFCLNPCQPVLTYQTESAAAGCQLTSGWLAERRRGLTGPEMWIDGFLRGWQLPVGQRVPAPQPCQRHNQRQGLTGGSRVGRLAPFVCIEARQPRQPRPRNHLQIKKNKINNNHLRRRRSSPLTWSLRTCEGRSQKVDKRNIPQLSQNHEAAEDNRQGRSFLRDVTTLSPFYYLLESSSQWFKWGCGSSLVPNSDWATF